MDEFWKSKEEPHARAPDILRIQLAIKCMTAAESLHIVKMKGHSMASLAQDVNTLVDAGHTIPPAQEVHIAFVQAREYMEGRKYCKAGAILSLTANSSPWSIGNAGFAQCAALSAHVESSLYDTFIELWCEAIPPNCFWKFLNTVEDMSSRKQFELWLSAQVAILDSCEMSWRMILKSWSSSIAVCFQVCSGWFAPSRASLTLTMCDLCFLRTCTGMICANSCRSGAELSRVR